MKSYKTDSIDIKQNNRHRIYDLVYKQKCVSKSMIASQLGISLPTAISNVHQLIEDGLLEEGEPLKSTGGRKATAITCRNDSRFAVGVDITMHHFSIVLVDMFGDIINRAQIARAFSDTPEYYSSLSTFVTDLINASGIEQGKILGSGISVPGILSADSQMLVYSHVLQVSGLSAAMIGRGLPGPILLCNDANAAGIAEMWNDSRADAVYLSLSNTVGGAIVVNHQLYKGQTQHAGEFGHMTLVRDGAPCYCGRKGCVDAYCSAKILSQYTDYDLTEFFRRIHEQDPYLLPVWDQFLSYLATMLNNLIAAHDCPIIIGGYLGRFLGEYLDKLRHMVSTLTTFPCSEELITICHYQQDAAAVGAALIFVRQFIESI